MANPLDERVATVFQTQKAPECSPMTLECNACMAIKYHVWYNYPWVKLPHSSLILSWYYHEDVRKWSENANRSGENLGKQKGIQELCNREKCKNKEKYEENR